MKRMKQKQALKDMKIIAATLYELYMAQSAQNDMEINCYHENAHDNSGSHPDYHNNSHDNTPGRMMTRTLVKNVSN